MWLAFNSIQLAKNKKCRPTRHLGKWWVVGGGLGYSVNTGQGPVLATSSQSLCSHSSALEPLTVFPRTISTQCFWSSWRFFTGNTQRLVLCASLCRRNLTYDFHFSIFQSWHIFLKLWALFKDQHYHQSVKVNFLWCLMIRGGQKELQSGFGKKLGISARHHSLITIKVFASSIIAQSISRTGGGGWRFRCCWGKFRNLAPKDLNVKAERRIIAMTFNHQNCLNVHEDEYNFKCVYIWTFSLNRWPFEA